MDVFTLQSTRSQKLKLAQKQITQSNNQLNNELSYELTTASSLMNKAGHENGSPITIARM